MRPQTARPRGFVATMTALVLTIFGGAATFAADPSHAATASSNQVTRFPRFATAVASNISLSLGLRSEARVLRANRNTSVDPLAAEPFYVRLDTPADRSVAFYRRHHDTQDANLISKIAEQPEAIWLTGLPGDLPSLKYTMAAARKAHQEVVVVLYNIPGRDCGSYSGGGATSPAAYKRWVNTIAAHLGSTVTGVVIEPDALSEQTCWSKAQRASNISLIRYAAKKVASRPHTAAYLDAGNPMWNSATVMARRLRQADVADVRGFVIDTASFTPTARAVTYGDAISRRTGGKHFVVDTSRDGDGPLMSNGTVEWCNPPGRALGEAPTVHTGSALVDAYLWIKIPGASDGSCNGGPVSGTWWPSYAIGLAQRAHW